MHELSVAQSILNSLERLKSENGFEVLRRVKISVGRLSGVDAEALRFALESLRDTTLIGSAVLDIVETSIRIRCNACSMETDVRQFEFKCLGCGASDYDIVSGDSLEITEIEVD